MPDRSIDIVHRFNKTTPSLRNLLQGLNGVDEPWRINTHALRPNIPGNNRVSNGVEVGLYPAKATLTAARIKKRAPDIVIVHKTLDGGILNRISKRKTVEPLFANYSKVVYSTYDADYVRDRANAQYLFKNSDLVYATSKAIEQEAIKHTNKEKIKYIPPSVNTEFFTPEVSVSERYNSEKLAIGWIGNASVHQEELQYIANVVQQTDKDIVLRLLLGGSKLQSETRQQLQDTDIEIDIIEYVEWERVPEVINSFDVGLAPLIDTEFNRGRSSEKIREYMACGVPVIASDIGENKYLIPDNAGILIDNEIGRWVSAIEGLSSNQKQRRYGKRAREYTVEQYSIPVIANRIKSEFNSLFH